MSYEQLTADLFRQIHDLNFFKDHATPLLRDYMNRMWAMGNYNEADAAARLIGDKLPSDHEKEDSKP